MRWLKIFGSFMCGVLLSSGFAVCAHMAPHGSLLELIFGGFAIFCGALSACATTILLIDS
jgi:hypothetical protein